MKIPLTGFTKGDRVFHRNRPLQGTVVQVTKTSLRVVWDGNWNVTNWVRKKSVTKSLNLKKITNKINKVKGKIFK